MGICYGVLDCGCIIQTDGSYIPCDYHDVHGFSKEEQEMLLLGFTKDVLEKIYKEK